MFERFSPDSRQVVVYAQDEARRLGHDWIGTDHLLLGILRGLDPAGEALRAVGLSFDRALALAGGLTRPREDGEITGMMPLTHEAKKALERASREAYDLHADEVEPRHLLLGVMTSRGGSAACILRDAAVDTDRVVVALARARRTAVADYRPDPNAQPEARPPAAGRRRRRRLRAGSVRAELDRLTDRSNLAVALAQEEARELGHDWLGTEHLLLGLLREREGLAARVLEELAITIEDVRERVVDELGERDDGSETDRPLSQDAKSAVKAARRVAAAMGDTLVATEHLLLGVAQVEDGLGAAILGDFGADAARVGFELERLLAAGGDRTQAIALTPLADSFIQVRLRQLIQLVGREHQAALGIESFERAAALKAVEKDLTSLLARVQRTFDA